MKRSIFPYSIFMIILASSCAVSSNPLRKDFIALEKGTVKENSSFVYHLPYQSGKKHLLAQGYFSRMSHKESAALDFKMPRGTVITAARGGVVVRVKQDGSKGGWNKKYRPEGNSIVIEHEDGSRAGYWHLQHNGAMVKVGDTVLQDQPIALSGKTGYALFPHLHFIVWQANAATGRRMLATRFQTATGEKYLRPGIAYRKPV